MDDVVWKPMLGFENLYKVSEDGRVWSERRQRLLKTPINKYRGYQEFCVVDHDGKQSTKQVHQEVARAFYGPAEGRCVRHLDGNPLNNNLNNLMYGTQLDNMTDRRFKKYTGGKRLISQEEIRRAEEMLSQGIRYKEVAKELGYSYGVILRNTTTKPATEVHNFVERCLQTGATVQVVAQYLEVTHMNVCTMMKKNKVPIRELRKKYPLNKSITVESLANIMK